MDVEAYLETLKAVQKMKGKLFIPAHVEPTDDITPLAKQNMEKVYEIANTITVLCRKPSSFETILAGVFDRYQLQMTFEQHALVGSTVRSYLTYLVNQGRLNTFIEQNMLLWSV